MRVLSSLSLTPPLNNEDPSPPSSVPVKPSSAEDAQDLVSPSPSRIPTLTTVQQVKYQRPVRSDFSTPVDAWLWGSPPLATTAPKWLSPPYTYTHARFDLHQPIMRPHTNTHGQRR
ncbi:hypothetical protein QQF64_025007 [Cirrhinus molitorella]|uniref:Uncharacterized protein n=1 Tax=Cirrhinus molitorella TaxID=172907 RepID=A0ABR3NN34_9TELE